MCKYLTPYLSRTACALTFLRKYGPTQRRYDGEVALPAEVVPPRQLPPLPPPARSPQMPKLAFGDRALLPGAAQLEVGLKVAEGWDPDWLPGGVDQ